MILMMVMDGDDDTDDDDDDDDDGDSNDNDHIKTIPATTHALGTQGTQVFGRSRKHLESVHSLESGENIIVIIIIVTIIIIWRGHIL